MAKKSFKFDEDAFDQVGLEVEEVPLSEEVERKYAGYTYYTIEDRALVNVVDGLKPVQRRILYAMYRSGFVPSKPHTKSTRIVGETMGNFHPHGDTSIYDALVRMAQPHTYNLRWIDGQGNFGMPGIANAADRYTECRLSQEGMLLVEELNKNPVPTVPNFDDTLQVPAVLPAQVPALLINGTSGIATAMAASMPPHNPREALRACLTILDEAEAVDTLRNTDDLETKDRITRELVDKITEVMPAPDFPTGAKVIGLEDAKEAYATGRGKVLMQSVYHITKGDKGKTQIVFTEFPYGTAPNDVISALKENEKKYLTSVRAIKDNNGRGKVEGYRIEGITNIDDYSDAEYGHQLIVDVDAKTNPEVVVAELFKRTTLQVSFNFNMNCLVQGTPRVISTPELLIHFLNFRRTIVKTSAANEMETISEKLHFLNGFLAVLVDIDKAISIIRASESQDEAQEALIKEFSIEEDQAKNVMNTQLRRLTKMDSLEVQKDKEKAEERVEYLNSVVEHREVRDKIVREQITALLERFEANPDTERKSTLDEDVTLKEYAKQQTQTLSQSREIQDEPIVLSLGEDHRIYRSAKRYALMSVDTTTLGSVVFLTNKGKAIKAQVSDMGNTHTPDLEEGERVVGISNEESPMVVGTKHGVIYAFESKYPRRSTEFSYINLSEGDEVLGAYEYSEDSEAVFVSASSSLLHFSMQDVRVKGSINGKGMVGMKTVEGDEAIHFASLSRVEQGLAHVATATESSIKETPFSEYPAKGRGTRGVRSHKFLKGEERLSYALVGAKPEFLKDGERVPVSEIGRRDGSGEKATVDGIRRVWIPTRKPSEDDG